MTKAKANSKPDKQPDATTPAAPSSQELVLRQELADAKAELELTLKVNAELTKEVERLAPYDPLNQNKPVLKSSTATFTHQGIVYGFAFTQVRYKGRLITADDVLTDTRLQAELIASRSGMLKKH